MPSAEEALAVNIVGASSSIVKSASRVPNSVQVEAMRRANLGRRRSQLALPGGVALCRRWATNYRRQEPRLRECQW